MLEKCKFNREDMKATIQAYLNGDYQKASEPAQPLQPIQDPDNAEQDAENEDDVDDENNRQKAIAYLRMWEPDLTLLPLGSFGKRVPLRCRICVTKSWPQGKIIELSQLKPNCVEHFVKQHVRGTRHQVRKRRAKNGHVVVDQTKCEGLCISSQRANKLYQFRDEFALWAGYCNFEETAKHECVQRANSREWFVRSANCLKDCDLVESEEYQTCRTCLALGTSHGVAWSVEGLVALSYTLCVQSKPNE